MRIQENEMTVTIVSKKKRKGILEKYSSFFLVFSLNVDASRSEQTKERH